MTEGKRLRLLARIRDVEDKLARLVPDLDGLPQNHAQLALEHTKKLKEWIANAD